jgi:AcrR family transcriptional regulator
MMAEGVPRQNRANRRRAQSFENLVQAGLAVIGERGLYETTIEHITEAADVGKGTFYAHFPSKEDLVYHLVRDGFDELIAAGRGEALLGRTAADQLAGLIRAQLRVLSRRRDLVILLHQVRGLLILQPEARRRLRREYQRYVRFLAEACRQVLNRPGLRSGEARDLACAIAGFVSGALSVEMSVRGSRGLHAPLQGPIKAFASGVAARYLPTRRSTNGRRPR